MAASRTRLRTAAEGRRRKHRVVERHQLLRGACRFDERSFVQASVRRADDERPGVARRGRRFRIDKPVDRADAALTGGMGRMAGTGRMMGGTGRTAKGKSLSTTLRPLPSAQMLETDPNAAARLRAAEGEIRHGGKIDLSAGVANEAAHTVT